MNININAHPLARVDELFVVSKEKCKNPALEPYEWLLVRVKLVLESIVVFDWQVQLKSHCFTRYTLASSRCG